MLNYGIIRPSLPLLTVAFFNGSVSQASLVAGLADATGALAAFIIMPLLGEYSDSNGRRPILLLTLLTTSLPVWSLCFYPTYLSLWFYFGSNILAKISTFSSVYSYVADTTRPSDRSSAFGQVSGVVFFALTLGPMIASVGLDVSFKIAAALSSICWIYAAFALPESLKLKLKPLPHTEMEGKMEGLVEVASESSSLVSNSNLGSTGSKSSSASTLISSSSSSSSSAEDQVGRKTHLSPFLTLRFMFRDHLTTTIFLMVLSEQLAVYGINEIFMLYLAYSLHFQRDDNIQFLTIAGILTCFIMLCVLPFASRKLGEKKLILLCIGLYLIYTSLYPFVNQIWEVYALMLLPSIAAMSYPATGSLVSNYVQPSEMGLAQGALSGVRALSLGVGPLIFALLFSASTMEGAAFQFPAAPFVLSAILTAISFIIANRIPDSPPAEGNRKPNGKDGQNRNREDRQDRQNGEREEEEDFEDVSRSNQPHSQPQLHHQYGSIDSESNGVRGIRIEGRVGGDNTRGGNGQGEGEGEGESLVGVGLKPDLLVRQPTLA